jgi:hypothetical protein
MYIQQLGEIVLSPNQNTVGFYKYNQITFPILYYTSSLLVTLLEVPDAPIKVKGIFYLTVGFKFLSFTFESQ